MHRLLRIAFNALAVFSLVLAVLVAGLWVRSYRVGDLITGGVPPRGAGFEWRSFDGCLRWAAGTSADGAYTFNWESPAERGYWWKAYGVEWQRDNGFGGSYIALSLPHFLWCVILLLPPMVALRMGCWSLRRASGHCPACGYDLRVTPDRCPECGQAAIPRLECE